MQLKARFLQMTRFIRMYMPKSNRRDRSITYASAINEATRQLMAQDDSVFVLGIGVDDPRGIYGTTSNLSSEFGQDRVVNMPLAEDAITGIASGSSMAGMRPIVVHERMDFMLLAMNQLINVAAKSHYMYGGAVKVPMVVRSIIGRSWGQGAQHSQALHSFFMHIPGLKVIAPTTPYDAKGALVASIRDDNPVIFVEHRMLHNYKGQVPENLYEVPFGKARVLRTGGDITIVGISHAMVECIRAAKSLAAESISAEVIDPISLSPIDVQTICESVEKTGNLLIVDNGWTPCGASAEIMSLVIENVQRQDKVKMKRMGFEFVTSPTTKILEDLYYPDSRRIAKNAYDLVMGKKTDWEPDVQESPEIDEFKGPF